MLTFLKDGIISKDNYGDWCVPPEDLKLIHSKDPKRKTSETLLATAYLFHDLQLMEQYATMLGKTNDACRFQGLAAQVKTAFNDKFLNRDLGQYDNGTQTSCVLPLAFGLVPDDTCARIFEHLVNKITIETKGHIGTGLVGGMYLCRVLSDHGRPDLAYTMATQTDYPGWGYMVGKGATTVWELWNGDTADPSMNSGNHVMLIGDLTIWLYQYLAGLRPDPEKPGYKHIILKPEVVGDLSSARGTHRSPYGLIVSDWHKTNTGLDWRVTIPPNTASTIYMPTKSAIRVFEGGKPVANSPGVKFVRQEDDRAVFQVGSGDYHFEVR
jgi:alpha-L-rhamnosidase